jgi:hypothetical protein
MKLVKDWKDFPKWFETWAATVGLAGSAAWHHIPDEWRQLLMNWKYAPYAVGALFVLTMVGTLVAQPSLAGAPKEGGESCR